MKSRETATLLLQAPGCGTGGSSGSVLSFPLGTDVAAGSSAGSPKGFSGKLTLISHSINVSVTVYYTKESMHLLSFFFFL